MLGVKQGRGLCCTAVGADWGLSCYEELSEPVLEWLGPAPTAHCLLGSHGPRDPNLREICVAFWKLIAMRNELVGGVGWGWKIRRKTRFCRNIPFVRSFVMTVCTFILAT